MNLDLRRMAAKIPKSHKSVVYHRDGMFIHLGIFGYLLPYMWSIYFTLKSFWLHVSTEITILKNTCRVFPPWPQIFGAWIHHPSRCCDFTINRH